MEIVSIIGPIGAGKSTFVSQLKKHNKFTDFYHEDVAGNKWLKMEPTVENQTKCQEYIISHKIDFYSGFENQDVSEVKILEDASFYQDLFYVYLNMYKQDPDTFSCLTTRYLDLIKKIYFSATKHTIIYIDIDIDQNLENIQKRGRDFESYIDKEFLINQREILLKILDQFKDKFNLIIYKPEPHMFESDDDLDEKFSNIFKNLGVI